MHLAKKETELHIKACNDHLAHHVEEFLAEKHVYGVNVMGAPGVGKTTVLENIIRNLSCATYVVEGDIESDIDTRRLQQQNIRAVQINTFGACHLDAPLMHEAMHKMEFPEPGLLFIENVGNLVCPAEFNIGEDLRVAILSVPEGDDKVAKYPLMFETTDALIMNKYDMKPYFDFDDRRAERDALDANPDLAVFRVSARTGEGAERFLAWLSEKVNQKINKEEVSR